MNLTAIIIMCIVICVQPLTNCHLYAQTITIQAAAYNRYHTPIYVTLQSKLPPSAIYQVKNVRTGMTTLAQACDANRLFFILPDSLEAGDQAVYELVKYNGKPGNPVTVSKSAEGIQVAINNKPLFFYHTAVAMPPSGSPAYYARSGFIHPLQSPAGKVLTDDFPEGHRHQHGIMTAWVNTRIRNVPIDFWNQHLRTGTVGHQELLGITNGPVGCIIKTRLQHTSNVHGKVLEELWTLTIYPFDNYFLFDLQSQQTNKSKDTLYLNQYHYGGMAFRGSKQWNPDDSLHFTHRWNITTDSGYTLANANATHAKYVTASGNIDKDIAGLTIFGFPSNLRFPQAIRVHPAMPYWCFTPVADGPIVIAPGQKMTAGYRLYAFDGAPNQQRIQHLQHDLQQPPGVKVKE